MAFSIDFQLPLPMHGFQYSWEFWRRPRRANSFCISAQDWLILIFPHVGQADIAKTARTCGLLAPTTNRQRTQDLDLQRPNMTGKSLNTPWLGCWQRWIQADQTHNNYGAVLTQTKPPVAPRTKVFGTTLGNGDLLQ